MNALINSESQTWTWWPIVPLYPYGKRRTLRQEVVKDSIWTFDQIQGILYVVVPIRMTVIRLESGGLLVYAPVAPTPECIALVRELVAKYGEVKYIILPTISGIEHKVFVGPFARQFPAAQVFAAPNHWSFPLNLPLTWLGLPWGRTHILPPDSTQVPFYEEFDYSILGPLELGLGRFEEVVFFHRRSRTLLATDLVVSIPEEPPAIVQLDPYPLLFHARDKTSDRIADTPENRRKGWQRIALLAMYLQPSVLKTIPWGKAFRQSLEAPDRSKKAYFGLFPFEWRSDWQQSFNFLRGRLLVAPILQTLILNRSPQEILYWADKVSRWNFQRIIPSHLDSPLTVEVSQFRQAFSFLQHQSTVQEENLSFLKSVDRFLIDRRVTPPPPKGFEP